MLTCCACGCIQTQGQWQWRASRESPYTGERQSFTNLEQLFAFLKEKTNLETIYFTRR
jgi:hypothetical protein